MYGKCHFNKNENFLLNNELYLAFYLDNCVCD